MYGIRYTLQFDSEKYGHDYKILIKENGYSGEGEKKALGSAPLLRRDDSDSGISGTSLELKIQSDVDGELTSLYTVDNKKFLVEVYRNEDLIWTGFVLPEKYSEPYISVPYDVSVSATDGLGILKDIPFELNGERTIFNIIQYCCNQTGLLLDFIVYSSLMESSMNSDDSMLVQTSFNTSTFQEKTCYDVLEELLTSLDAFITENNGKWVIARYTDLNQSGYLYSNSGIIKGRVPVESLVLGNVDSGVYPIGNLELEVEPASKSVKFISDYELKPSFLQNYDFSNGKSGWTGFEFIVREYKGLHFATMHNTSGKKERYIQQVVNVEKSKQDVVVEIKFALARMNASMDGHVGEDRKFALKIQLSGGGQTYYLADEGWKTNDYRFEIHGGLQDMYYNRSNSMNYVDGFDGSFKIVADGFPVSGQLTLTMYNVYIETGATSAERASLFLDYVILTNNCSKGVDVSVNLAEKASTSYNDVDVRLTDVPFTENADNMFYNGLKIAGKYTSSWSCGEKSDSFLYTILKSVCSRIGFSRRQLSGTIQGQNLHTFMLLVDKYSDLLFYIKESSLNLLADELEVTLEQFMPYIELSGETTESERTTNNSASEYRSSGENEVRVYQSGSGVPMRIKDLSQTELQPDSVIEVDRNNTLKSGKVTLKKLLEFILTTGEVWTKEELKMVEGYLLYLGEKIKAGDSDLWEGHHFDDYLNQFLLTTSDVEFKSVLTKILTTNEITTPDFVSGLLGSGARLKDNHLELDEITVRKRMNVFQLVIQKVMHQGGILILSPGGTEITSVVDGGTYYKCTFDTKNGKLKQPFVVDDQLLCQSFDEGNTRRYWRRITSVGEDYFNLSKTDCEENSAIPAVGDEVVVLGNRTDVSRQNALILQAVGDDAPYMDTYDDINSFSLDGKLCTREGNLSGIVDEVFGQLGGTGLYAKRVYLRGKFALDTGDEIGEKLDNLEDNLVTVSGRQDTQEGNITEIRTKVEALPGQITQEVSGVIDWTKKEINTAIAETITSIVEEYYLSNSATSLIGGSWVSTSPAWVDGKFTWKRSLITYADNTITTTSPVCVTGATGATGPKGDTGPTGSQGIPGTSQYFHVKYSANSNGNPMVDIPNTYIGTSVTSSATAPTTYTSYKWVQLKGAQGAKGDQGIKGATGSNGVSSYLHIKYSDNGTTFTANGGETPGAYIGQYVDTMAADSTTFSKYTWTKVKGDAGAKGDKGATGATGAAGKGVKSTVVTYQASTSGTTVPTGTWGSSIPSVAANSYLWTRTIITYTDNATSTSYAIGKMGATGATGATGKGVKSTAVTYQSSTSGTTIPTGTWGSTIPSVAANSYLWTRTIITYTDNTTSTSYSIGKMGATGATGSKGDTGAQGIPGESLHGKMLNRDPEFRKGNNGVSMYNNTSGGNVTVTRIARPSDCPTTSGYCLKIKTAGAASPGCGGFVLSIQSRANAVFIQKIIAKIPVGYTITNASNSMGTGYTDTWLTSRAGTGKYETYLRKVVCGATGSFSSGGHVYLSGSPTPTASAPLEWYLAYCTVFDQTQDEGIDNLLAIAKSELVTGINQNTLGITLYAKQTDFNALGTRVSTTEATIKTQASNIELKVSKNGVVAAINASPETVKISAAKIDLVGKVTFSMLDTNAQSTVNGKITSAQATTIATTQVNTLKNSLGSLAYLSKVEQAQLGTTLIEGGYIKTSLIRTDLILSAGAEIGEFKIGDINGKGGRWLTASNNTMGLSGSQLAFNKSDRNVYIGSHPSEGTGGVPILGYFNIGPTTPTLKSTEKCALYAAAPLHSSYLIKSYALYAECGSVRIVYGGFGGMVRSFSLSGSSATIDCNFLTGSINSATSGMVVRIQPGFEGQRLALLNYSGVGFSIYRNDRNSLSTKIPSECSALLYYTGSTWLPVQVGNLYYT